MQEWLILFGLHSTVWLGLATLFVRWRPQIHARSREVLWHSALAASFIAPTLQVAAPEFMPGLWRLPVDQLLNGNAPEETAMAVDTIAVSPEILAALQRRQAELAAQPAAPVAQNSAWQRTWHQLDWQQLRNSAWLLWAGLAGLLLLRYASRLGLLRRRLSAREIIESSPERCALVQLSRRAGLRRAPRLTESDSIGSPLAFGLGRRAEICVPTRAIHELEDDQFCAMLGHEVAHHMRRDPLRLTITQLLQAAFFFQPLLRVAARQLHLAAEEQCDAWGASHLEDRLAMASCLTEVAAWVMPRDRRVPVAGMAAHRSQLRHRVECLMDDDHGFEAPGRTRRTLFACSILALAPWLGPQLDASVPLAGEDVEHNSFELHPDREEASSFYVKPLLEARQQLAQVMLALAVEAYALELETAAVLDEMERLGIAALPQYYEEYTRVRASLERLRRIRGHLQTYLQVIQPAPGPGAQTNSRF